MDLPVEKRNEVEEYSEAKVVDKSDMEIVSGDELSIRNNDEVEEGVSSSAEKYKGGEFRFSKYDPKF